MNNQIEIEYACDSEGDHTVATSECVTSKIKTFSKDDVAGIDKFISEASYVYNLDKVLGAVNRKLVPEAANQVLKVEEMK
jgi:hypothetical protein